MKFLREKLGGRLDSLDEDGLIWRLREMHLRAESSTTMDLVELIEVRISLI